MLTLARSYAQVAAAPDALDAKPGVLNCANGTVDLDSGRFRPADPADLLTKQAAAPYDPAAPVPTWRAVLDTAFAGDPEMVDWFQRAVGYAAMGAPREHLLFVCYGTGANGKSTILGAIQDVLGDYARSLPVDALISHRGEFHPAATADLPGARFVVASEANDGARLDEAVVKRLASTDRITARRMHQDWFEFAPSHVIFLATNHRPTVRGGDGGTARRLVLVPFTVTIPEDRRDPDLPARLRGEAAGILAWVVAGVRAYRDRGLRDFPAAVRRATQDYLAENDTPGLFLEDCTAAEARTTVKSAALYRAYRLWCEVNGYHAASQTTFAARLKDRASSTNTRAGRLWRGLRLVETSLLP